MAVIDLPMEDLQGFEAAQLLHDSVPFFVERNPLYRSFWYLVFLVHLSPFSHYCIAILGPAFDDRYFC